MTASRTLCPIPWHSISIRNDGLYRVCCHANISEGSGLLKNADGKPLSATNTSINQARNSATLQNMRVQMIEGKWPSQCRRCQSEEAAGVRSKRLYSSEYIPLSLDTLEQTNTQTGQIDSNKIQLKDGDLRFGNKCNLKCRMCGPSDSSAWSGDFQKLTGREYTVSGDFNWFTSSEFWLDFESNANNLEHLYLVGGEPLLIEEHFLFLQRLVKLQRSQKIVLEYNTNLTTLDDKVIELWKSFKEVRVGISIDAFGDLNDYIRFPSKFKNIEKNLDRLDKSDVKLRAWLATTISIYNFLDLNDLFLWKIDKNFCQIGQSVEKPLVTTHFLHKPDILSIKHLPQEVKDRVLQVIPQMRRKFLSEIEHRSIKDEQKLKYLSQWDKIFQGIEKFMTSTDRPEESVFNSSKDWNQRLDSIRNNQQRPLSELYKSVFEGYL